MAPKKGTGRKRGRPRGSRTRKRSTAEAPDTMASELPELPAPTLEVGPAGPAPSLDDAIGESVGSGDAASAPAATALDSLAARIEAESAAAAASVESQPEPDARRGPGRPRKDAAPVVAPTILRDLSRATKADLEKEVRQLQERNALLAAQTDSTKLNRLAQSIEFLTVTCFAPLAIWRGPHWEMTEEEAREIAEPTAHALAPYADDIEEQLPWAAPVIALTTAVARRVMIDVRISREAAAREGARVSE